MKYVFIISTIFSFAICSMSFAGGKKKMVNGKKVYIKFCQKQTQKRMSLNHAQDYCKCLASEMLEKVNESDLVKLARVRPELSEEEAVKVENVDEDLYTLESLEYDAGNICKLKSSKNKKFSINKPIQGRSR